ncbi:BQ2448_968 [Microbotryum intermedium]|uniref:BQ2448_968 protein n=1 Tax=Microbotryum intermedium TaxID=269621 RepID=A0A238F6R6_9BASI|nr:BQ2448_968 [Microbotryum intermedium]
MQLFALLLAAIHSSIFYLFSVICQVSACPSVANAVAVCTSNQTCDFTCNSGFNKVNGACVPVCDATKCPTVANSQSICTSSGTCDFTCNTGYNKVDGACVLNTPVCDPANCPVVANSVSICTSGKCDFTCNVDYTKVGDQCLPVDIDCGPSLKLVDGKCVCDVTKCPAPSNSAAVCISDNKCSFNCNTGYKNVNGACVPNIPVCDVTKCPTVANSQSICTSSGTCDFTCNSGYNKVDGACVPKTPVCDVTKCPSCDNGSAICTSTGKCDMKCNSGYKKVNAHASMSVAFYDNFQTTKNGEPAVTVASIEACAAYCLTRGCASFDFWGGDQCGIQIGGGGFDGFQYSPGVVHGVPGQCSDYNSICPADVANKACYNKSVW